MFKYKKHHSTCGIIREKQFPRFSTEQIDVVACQYCYSYINQPKSESRLKSWTTDYKSHFNPLTPIDHYSGRTAPLTSKHCILYIYSTKTGTEYFKHGIYSPFFSLENAVCFIIPMYLVPVLFTFYIQGVLKFKKIIPASKG